MYLHRFRIFKTLQCFTKNKVLKSFALKGKNFKISIMTCGFVVNTLTQCATLLVVNYGKETFF